MFFVGASLQYAQDTQHEKILRGLAVGISLTMYGRMEEADALIESLSRDKDPILRWAGMYTLAMAYCGSGNNQAIRSLLHVAVSSCCSFTFCDAGCFHSSVGTLSGTQNLGRFYVCSCFPAHTQRAANPYTLVVIYYAGDGIVAHLVERQTGMSLMQV